MEITFNKQGTPLLFLGKASFGSTVKKTAVNEEIFERFSFEEVEYACWGSANRWPEEALEVIGKTGVLSTGLNYKCRCCYGQGVIPVNLTGLDEQNREQYAPVNRPEVLNFLRGYTFRSYHTNAFRDLIKLGNCFPVFVFSADGNRILRTEAVNARHCRISIDKSKVLLFGEFNRRFPDDTAKVIPMLNEADPFTHLQVLKEQGRLKGGCVAFPRIRNYFSGNDYYALPEHRVEERLDRHRPQDTHVPEEGLLQRHEPHVAHPDSRHLLGKEVPRRVF